MEGSSSSEAAPGLKGTFQPGLTHSGLAAWLRNMGHRLTLGGPSQAEPCEIPGNEWTESPTKQARLTLQLSVMLLLLISTICFPSVMCLISWLICWAINLHAHYHNKFGGWPTFLIGAPHLGTVWKLNGLPRRERGRPQRSGGRCYLHRVHALSINKPFSPRSQRCGHIGASPLHPTFRWSRMLPYGVGGAKSSALPITSRGWSPDPELSSLRRLLPTQPVLTMTKRERMERVK